MATETSEIIGSASWLERTGGRLTFVDRLWLVSGAVGALREGFRLSRAARRDARYGASLDAMEPPDTTMIRAARAYVAAHAHPSMANHAYRTAVWALAVLRREGELTPNDIETTWVASLLHDVGLDAPPERGDFALGGVRILESLAREHRWDEEQTHFAGEAIATNLSVRVDAARSGKIAWAMNVGGLGELGFGVHRAQIHPSRIAEIEALYPRADFRETARRLIREEARRVPGGRFDFFRWIFPILLRG